MTQQSEGLLGSTAIIPEDNTYLHNQRIGLITVDETKADKKFVNYLFRTKNVRFQIEGSSSGTKVKHTSPDKIYDVDVWLPDLENQRKIGEFLSIIDETIRKNNDINHELEEIAQIIYNYWFVQFEFPNEEGMPYKSSGGEMAWNDELKRYIPKDWDCVFLKDKLIFERGIEPGSKNYKRKKVSDDYIKFYRVSDIDNECDTYIDKKIANEKLVSKEDVLVSFDGTVGKIGIGLSGAYSTGIRKVYSINNEFSNALIYFLFKDSSIQQTIKSYATGSNILHAGASIEHLKIAFNKKIYSEFERKVLLVFQQILLNKEQNEELVCFRNFLFPMLMNGQVTLNEE